MSLKLELPLNPTILGNWEKIAKFGQVGAYEGMRIQDLLRANHRLDHPANASRINIENYFKRNDIEKSQVKYIVADGVRRIIFYQKNQNIFHMTKKLWIK